MSHKIHITEYEHKILSSNLRKRLGVTGLDRVIRTLEIMASNEEKVSADKRQKSRSIWIPGLHSQPFFKVEEFPWHKSFSDSLDNIRDDFLNLSKRSIESYTSNGQHNSNESLGSSTIGSDWSSYPLCRNGEWYIENCRKVFRTATAIDELPIGVGDVMFSILKGGASIPPHHGLNNYTLTVHVGVSVPQGCSLSVHDEVYHWSPMDVIVFDDSFLHSATNESLVDRCVLLIDIWHPSLSEKERIAIRMIEDMIRKI